MSMTYNAFKNRLPPDLTFALARELFGDAMTAKEMLEAANEAQRRAIIRVLKARFGVELGRRYEYVLEETSDPHVLRGYLDMAITCPDMATIQNALCPPPPFPNGNSLAGKTAQELVVGQMLWSHTTIKTKADAVAHILAKRFDDVSDDLTLRVKEITDEDRLDHLIDLAATSPDLPSFLAAL